MSKRKQIVSIFLNKSGAKDYDVSMKTGNMCMNRFCIDEEAGFELTDVYILRSHMRVSNLVIKKLKIPKQQSDEEKIQSAIRKTSEYNADDYEPHFVFAGESYQEYHLNLNLDPFISLSNQVHSGFRELMKKYRFKSVMVTFLHLYQHYLITKEEMKYYCLEEDRVLRKSINDDLETFFQDLEADKISSHVCRYRIRSYLPPKLTENETTWVGINPVKIQMWMKRV